MITGGCRSGKSSYAQRLALELSDSPVYMATSRVWDEEHRKRIQRHQQERGNEWVTIEEEKELSRHELTGKVVLVDCVTLWATNYFYDMDADVDCALDALKQEFDKLTAQDTVLIMVTNEIGMGGVSADGLQQKFADLQGWLNQYIAAKADEVYLMAAGIPVKIKWRVES